MTIGNWLQKSVKKLKSASVPIAQLDAEVLLAYILKKDRSWVHAHPDHELHRSDLRKLDDWVKRRMSHEPIAYIRGKQEFYGRDFIVSPDTLTPRPETETMIDLTINQVNSLQLTDDSQLQIVDVGTGSGCIIITAALELTSILNLQSSISYFGLDISQEAIKIAKQNAKKLQAKVKFKQFNLIANDISTVIKAKTSTVVLANLPYVPNDFNINLAATHEPGFAIFGGKDGLDYYRMLFKQLSELKVAKGKLIVLTEALPPHHKKLATIANDAGFRLIKNSDFIQLFESY